MYELTTQGAVQERVGVPSAMATAKMITHLDPGALTWIAVAEVMVATLVHDDDIDIDIVIGRGILCVGLSATRWHPGSYAPGLTRRSDLRLDRDLDRSSLSLHSMRCCA